MAVSAAQRLRHRSRGREGVLERETAFLGVIDPSIARESLRRMRRMLVMFRPCAREKPYLFKKAYSDFSVMT